MPAMLASAATYVAASLPTQVLLWSTAALAVGLLVKVRNDAVHARFLDTVPLSRVEKEQMHLPSVRVITGVFLCSVALLVVVLGVQQAGPGNAYWWLPTVATFVLGASVGTLAELRWKRTREMAFAVIVGSAMAFIGFVAVSPATAVRQAWQLSLLVLVAALAWKTFVPSWSASTRAAGLLAFACWVLILTWIAG